MGNQKPEQTAQGIDKSLNEASKDLDEFWEAVEPILEWADRLNKQWENRC